MLVLTRRCGESIMIGDDIRVVVLDVRGDTIRLGIEAPREVQVHRAEVYAEVTAANAGAASSASGAEMSDAVERLRRSARPASATRRVRRPGPPSAADDAPPPPSPTPRPPTPRQMPRSRP